PRTRFVVQHAAPAIAPRAEAIPTNNGGTAVPRSPGTGRQAPVASAQSTGTVAIPRVAPTPTAPVPAPPETVAVPRIPTTTPAPAPRRRPSADPYRPNYAPNYAPPPQTATPATPSQTPAPPPPAGRENPQPARTAPPA